MEFNNEIHGSTFPKFCRVGVILLCLIGFAFVIINASNLKLLSYAFLVDTHHDSDVANDKTIEIGDFSVERRHNRILKDVLDEHTEDAEIDSEFEVAERDRNLMTVVNNSTIQENRSNEAYNAVSDNVTYFYRSLAWNVYSGNWTLVHTNEMNNLLNEFRSNTGTINVLVEQRIYLNDKTPLTMNIRLLDGKCIDRWFHFMIKGLMTSKTILTNTTTVRKLEEKDVQVYLTKGEIFDRIQDDIETTINISFMNWEIKKIQSKLFENESFVSKVSGTLEFSGTVIKFQLELGTQEDLNKKVYNYSIILTVFGFIQLLNSFWINYNISDTPANSNSLSIVNMSEKVVWNVFICMSHIFFTINQEDNSFYFCLPALFYFINFSLFEIRILFNIIRNKNLNQDINSVILRKKLIFFYFCLYLLMFFAMFFSLKFLFYKKYFFLVVLLTWTPQIVFNIITNNRLLMPLVNVVLLSINKLIISIYFRGYEGNFFNLAEDRLFLFICATIIGLQVAFLYLQSYFGARFFLPEKYRQKKYNYYKDPYEIVSTDSNFSSAEHECVICLFSLMDDKSKHSMRLHTSNEALPSSIQGSPNSVTSSDFSTSINREERSVEILSGLIEDKPQNSFKDRCLNICYILFRFHEVSKEKTKKPFMVTPCNHIFHTQCLEYWFRQKRDCPTCRNPIPYLD